MNTENQINIPPSKNNDCLSPFVLLITASWLVITAIVRFTSVLFASTMPGPESNQVELTSALFHAVSLILPLFILSRWWKNNPYRRVFQAWLWSAASLLLFSPLFLIEVDEAQLMGITQIGLLIVYILILLSYKRKMLNMEAQPTLTFDNQNKKPVLWTWMLSTLIGLLSLAPWVVNGALGSILDFSLNLVLAILLSIAAILVIESFIWIPLPKDRQPSVADYLITATGISGVLHILMNAMVFPFGGMHFLLWLSIPILGWALTAIWFLSTLNSWSPSKEPVNPDHSQMTNPSPIGPIRLLISLGILGPLAWIDADELALVISGSLEEILFVALKSAGISLGIGIIFSIFLSILSIWVINKKKNFRFQNTTLVSIFLALASAFVAGSILFAYWNQGQPGLHGERMLIIMVDQLDVSSAKEIQNYSDRREFVYQSLTDHALESQGDIRHILNTLNISYTPYYLVNAIETGDNPFLRAYLQFRPEVDRILDSPRMRPLPDIPDTSLSQPYLPLSETTPWNIRQIQADRVWQEYGITGQGILIGQSDSGVQGDHPDLAAQYRGQDDLHDYSWFDPWYASPAPVDIGGHGTHTLGTALGKKTGVAPDAEWIACVNLARNLGNPALYLDCMQFMLAPFPQSGDPFTQGEPTLGAHVLNNSWGCPEFEGCDPQVFSPAVKALEAAGIFVVAGAGNDGPVCSSINSPLSIYTETFAVGAIDSQGNLASFSSLGPVSVDGSQRTKPDLVAPGVDVLSTLPDSRYGAYSGTSMASPHLVGVVALLWSANPDLIGDIDTTWEILTQTAMPFSKELPDCPGANETPSTAVGYGIVDAYAAVQMALEHK